jgi:hypothetical protein
MSNCCFTTRENYFSFTTRDNCRKADIIIPSRKATITHSRNSYSSLVIECHNIAEIILHSRKADIILPSRKADIILSGRKAK